MTALMTTPVFDRPRSADPTVAFVERFRHRDQWDAVIESVPIFRPFLRLQKETSDGKKQFRIIEFSDRPPSIEDPEWTCVLLVDVPRLQEIARRMQMLQNRYGVVAPFKIGHTRLPAIQFTQDEQPEVVGYGPGARFGTWGPENTPGVLVDLYVERGKLQRAKGYPFRSSEFYPNLNEITAVCLIRIDPDLNLGMLALQRTDEQVYHFQMQGEIMPEAPAPEQSSTAAHTNPTKPPDALAPSPQESEAFMRCMKHHYPHMDAMHEHFAKSQRPEQLGAGMSPASPTNAAPVSPPPEKKPDADQYQRAAQEEAARLEAQRKAQDDQQIAKRLKELEDAEQKRVFHHNRTESARMVEHWESLGIHIKDKPKELEKLMKMDDQGRADRDAEVQEHYQRAPTGDNHKTFIDVPHDKIQGDNPDTFQASDLDEVKVYLKEHPGASFEAAEAHAIKTRKERQKK